MKGMSICPWILEGMKISRMGTRLGLGWYWNGVEMLDDFFGWRVGWETNAVEWGG